MAQKNTNDIIEVCGKIAKILLENGAETTRVESTVEYIGRAAGIQLKCHATMTAIFVNAKNATGSLTRLEKPRVSSFNLQKLMRSIPCRENFLVIRSGSTNFKGE